MRRHLTVVTVIGLSFLVPQAYPDTPSSEQAMAFEVAGAWLTAPDLLSEFGEEDLWSTRTIPLAELAGGVKLSVEHVKQGRYSGKWSDHPRYPTIHTPHVPADWTGFTGLSFWAYSEERTDELIALAVESDSPETPWKDYFLHDFAVDWTGWRQLEVPLGDFDPHGAPAGWEKVGAVYFFTKILDRQPNPYTVLHLDDLKLETRTLAAKVTAKPAQPREGRLRCEAQVPDFDPGLLNHGWPETRDERPVAAPIQYESYFKAERALFGYYPRFQPGFVSFDPGGRSYLQYGSYIIETVDGEGRWTYRNLLDKVLEPYARETLGFAELGIGNSAQTNDAGIRFDADGDAYVLCFIWDPTKDARSRRGLLLHSRDELRTWDVYPLPNYMARFEKLAGHNRDCLSRPPVLLLSTYFAPTTNFITIPEKQPDGTLAIPEPVKVADDAIPFIPHSGEASNAVTVGDKVFLVYGKLEVLPGHTVEDGVPNYAVVYDIGTRALSEPVLLGFGGRNAEDNHNWPSIALDSQGFLHVVINGHHDPFVYVRSKQPQSIAEWTEPEEVAKATSYAGLVCGPDDTLYSVTRNSDPGYYFRLSLHRKKPGQPWEEPRHLVLPFKAYYKVWFHKLAIDPVSGRLFLSYYSQSPSVCLFKDEFLAYLYTWPDREKHFLSGADGPKVPTGTYRKEPRKYEFYGPPASEPTTLVSDDGGDTWHLATTKDFFLAVSAAVPGYASV